MSAAEECAHTAQYKAFELSIREIKKSRLKS